MTTGDGDLHYDARRVIDAMAERIEDDLDGYIFEVSPEAFVGLPVTLDGIVVGKVVGCDPEMVLTIRLDDGE